tara:strand:- start:280 stop:618 length:339 start_codon:yes stop_codon:yes gene_type:complete
MGFFSYFCPKIFPSETDATCEDEQKEMQKIQKKRMKLLPFAWKYRIACDTKKEVQNNSLFDKISTVPPQLDFDDVTNNLKNTEELSEKCEILYDSAKTFQQLTKQLSEKYKQ